MTVTCPRCGYTDSGSVHCPKCGDEYIVNTEWDKIPERFHVNRKAWLRGAAPYMRKV